MRANSACFFPQISQCFFSSHGVISLSLPPFQCPSTVNFLAFVLSDLSVHQHLFLFLLFQDTRGTVEKICDFLGKKLEKDELDLVLKYSSFQVMKENKMSNMSIIPEDVVTNGLKLMRKGEEKYIQLQNMSEYVERLLFQ